MNEIIYLCNHCGLFHTKLYKYGNKYLCEECFNKVNEGR